MATPTIESLRFDTADWKYHGEREPGKMRLWETPTRDAISLHFFGIPPDLPNVATVEQLRELYNFQFSDSTTRLVECNIDTIASCPAVRLLIKVPQSPTGVMYQGAFTIPFSEFSFVIKVQSLEKGITGVREAILTERQLAAGVKPNISGSGPIFPNWNPDAAEFDDDFPKHPVSRARRLMAAIAQSATLDLSVARAKCFPLPMVGA